MNNDHRVDRPAESSRRGPLTAVRVLVWAAVVQTALLAVTGAYLFFEYRPGSGFDSELATRVRIAHIVQAVHRIDSQVLLLTLFALAVVAIVVHIGHRRERVTAWALAAVAALASFTGFVLPWDQLALFAVTVGTNFSGYQDIIAGDVRFVIIGNSEIGTATLTRWLWIHLGLGVIALGGSVWLLARLRRRLV